ncbi:MAG: hypothetical protein ACYTG2_03445 [Planctomycetota bacterium]|jgi:hypothetical protein
MSAPNRDKPPASQSEEWKLPGGSEQCSACSTELLPGDPVTSSIRLAAEGPERKDLCASCGEAVPSEGELFYWRRVLPESAQRRPVVDYAMLREIFSRLLQREQASYQRLAYLVALVLIRKRHLRLVAFEAREGREVMLVRRAAGHPTVEVPAPYLGPEEMVEVRDQLTRLMAAELPDEGDLFAPPEPDEQAPGDAGDDADGDAHGDTDAEAASGRPEPEGTG